MAKKMKKIIALVLALALCAGQLAVPVSASELTGGDDVQPPITSENVTVTIDPATGSVTTVTETSTVDPATGTQTTTSEVVSVSGGDGRTEVDKDWTSTTTQTGSDTQDGNPTVQTDTDIVTTVTGSEDILETTDHVKEGTLIYGQIEGQETTDIKGTTVITTTETGVIVDNQDFTDETVTSGEWANDPTTTDNAYKPGTETYGPWVDEKIQPGQIIDEDTQTKDGIITPDYEESVTLVLKPEEQDKPWVTKSYEVKLEDIAKLPTDTSKYTITERRNDKGELIGWTVTYKEVITTPPTPSSPAVPVEGTWTPVGDEKDTYINPGDYTVGSTTTGDDIENLDNGVSVTVTYEDIYVDGIYEGYRIIKATTTKATGDPVDLAVGTRTVAEHTEEVGKTLYAGFTMPPERPDESVTTNEYGGKTTVTVQEILEDGKPVGYTVVTEVRNMGGDLMRSETRNIYGTHHTTQTTVVTDPTAERTTTTTLTTVTEVEEVRTIQTTQEMNLVNERLQTYKTEIVNEDEVYQLVDTGSGMYFLYQGKMYLVQAVGTHGDTTTQTVTPDMDLIRAWKGKDLRDKTGNENGLYGGYGDAENDEIPEGYDFRFVGNGAASTLRVRYWDAENQKYTYSTNHQFALRDENGALHYVYCCDLDTSAKAGSYYEIENLKDAGYYSTEEGSDVVDHIRTVASKGFWATEGGKNTTGTLEAVKQLLKDYDGAFDADLTAVANSLTEGQALTATQAALWAFGNKGSIPDTEDLVHEYDTNGNATDSIDERNVRALYELLISDELKNGTIDTSTDLLDAADITGSAITIHGEATNDDGSVKTEDGKTVYNTDVTFELSVVKSDLTGNLKVVVMQGDKVVREVQLVTEDSNLFGKIIADGKEVGASYTIEDLELIEGVNISLNLEGTQNLREGVYLYTAQGGDTASQTFVGIASGERTVDLEVDLVFDVEDPEISYENTKVTQIRLDTQKGTQNANRTDSKKNEQRNKSGNTKTTASHAVAVVATVTTTETKKDITKEERSWKAYYDRLLTENPKGGGDDPVRDEDVPLAKAPKTGDLSGLWLAISCMSLGGVVLLNRKREYEV